MSFRPIGCEVKQVLHGCAVESIVDEFAVAFFNDHVAIS